MTKNFLFAGVSAVALVLSTAAFADADHNTSADHSSTNVNLSGDMNVTSGDNRDNNNGFNHGQIGNGNANFDVDVDLDTHAVDSSKNYTNNAEFSHNDSVTASVLGATIAASDVDFKPRDGAGDYQGNIVGTGAFNGSNGILAVNQNTGINANNQQAITVSVGSVTVGGTAPAQGGL